MDKFMIIGQKERFFAGSFEEAIQKAMELFKKKQDVRICKKMSKESHRKYCISPAYDWKKQYAEDPLYRSICRFDWKNRQGITF